MKHRHLRMWGAVLALLVVAGSAFGQGVTRNKYLAGTPWAPAINDTITNCGAIGFTLPNAQKWCAESTGVFQTNGYSEILVFMRVLGVGGDTSTVARFAVRFKATGIDTGRTLPPDSMAGIYVRPNVAASVTTPESLSASYSALVPPAGSGTGVYLGEKLIGFNAWPAANKSGSWFAPHTYVFPLSDISGPIWKAGRGQIVVRCVSYINGTLASKPRVQLWVEGVQ